MTARALRKAIVKDLRELFKNRLYMTPDHTLAPPHVFGQRLPQRDAQAEDDPFTYIIVRLDQGSIDSPTAPHKVNVLFIIGAYDDGFRDNTEPPPEVDPEGETWDDRNFGDDAVLEIMELIQAHYEQHPSLDGGAYHFDGPFKWALQEEQSYPYYFGGCEAEFTLAAPRRERSQFT